MSLGQRNGAWSAGDERLAWGLIPPLPWVSASSTRTRGHRSSRMHHNQCRLITGKTSCRTGNLHLLALPHIPARLHGSALTLTASLKLWEPLKLSHLGEASRHHRSHSPTIGATPYRHIHTRTHASKQAEQHGPVGLCPNSSPCQIQELEQPYAFFLASSFKGS